ncbi:MAG TPA: nif-specific transcriptional activator NifA [Candidatus Sulfotelmatobacter sp.]|jgi:Nif-specific regulatory protein|nr:nif-specific transcriptional activator NifA [Candidatus Sulfotelmatobacter sp.]
MPDNRNSSALSLISIYEISKILSSSLNLEKTLREVVNLLSSYLEMRRGMVTLVSDKTQLEVVAAAGMTPDALKREGGNQPASALVSLVGRVVATGMPIVIPDLAEEPLVAEAEDGLATLDDEIVAFIGVPIKAAEKTIGVLSIDRVRDSEHFDVNFEADVRFLTMVANLVGQTVRLHQSVANERERLLLEQHRLQKAVQAEAEPGRFNIDNVIGVSRRMQDVYAEIHQIAPSRSTVLLRGESGTGKELIARAVHFLSPRKDGAFIKVNCAALPETLLESELFGHEKGAFTGANAERKGRFELAHGGTLFLDEIGEISGPFQAKLLRVLQEGEFERVGGNRTIKVDVRLVCATNRNLEEMVAKGDFRADLYYRINVVPIFLPPLRERKEDIPLLVGHFVQRFNTENNRHVRIAPEAMEVLMACYFPGNVRELENCVYRVATLVRGDVVREADFACQRGLCLSSSLWKHSKPELAMAGQAPGGFVAPAPCAANCVDPHCQEAKRPALAGVEAIDVHGEESYELSDDLSAGQQRERLLKAMEKAGWVQAKAARLLNLTPRQVGYALKKYNIEVKRI